MLAFCDVLSLDHIRLHILGRVDGLGLWRQEIGEAPICPLVLSVRNHMDVWHVTDEKGILVRSYHPSPTTDVIGYLESDSPWNGRARSLMF